MQKTETKQVVAVSVITTVVTVVVLLGVVIGFKHATSPHFRGMQKRDFLGMQQGGKNEQDGTFLGSNNPNSRNKDRGGSESKLKHKQPLRDLPAEWKDMSHDERRKYMMEEFVKERGIELSENWESLSSEERMNFVKDLNLHKNIPNEDSKKEE